MGTKGGGRDPGGAMTALGALLLLAAGVALGVGYNAVGLASRPPRGLAWIAERGTPGVLGSLESLEPPAAAAPAPDPAPAANAPRASATPAAGSRAASTPAPVPTTPHAPRHASAPRAANPAPTRDTIVTAEATAPASVAVHDSAPPPSPPVSALAPPPVLPDIAGPLSVELPLFKRLYDAGRTLVVDARGQPEYEAGHIAAAVNVPYEHVLAEPERVKALDPQGRAVVVYCSGGRCELSKDLADVLVQAGLRRVLVYEGGYPEWEAAGYPVTRGPAAGTRP